MNDRTAYSSNRLLKNPLTYHNVESAADKGIVIGSEVAWIRPNATLQEGKCENIWIDEDGHERITVSYTSPLGTIFRASPYTYKVELIIRAL